MSADLERQDLRIVVRGRVQGVAFRYFTRRFARRLGVVGWVRNRADGSVEIEAGGDHETMERFLEGVRKGPPAARVKGVETEPLTVPLTAASFEIRV